MFAEIHNLLKDDEVDYLVNLSRRGDFTNGTLTNPNTKIKNNLQLKYTDKCYAEAARIAHHALTDNKDIMNFAFPKHIGFPMMTKYEEGMYYGIHCDAPYVSLSGQRVRSDVSCTIFLHDPDTYDGGELSVQLGNGQIDFKLPAGSAILYPSHTFHEVLPVTRGERLAMITFIESVFPEQQHREVLYQLNKIKKDESLNISWESRTRLSYVSASLERMWSNKNG